MVLRLVRRGPFVKTRDDGRLLRQVDEGARPVGGDDLAAPDLPVRLPPHASPDRRAARRSYGYRFDLRLHVAQRAVDAELAPVRGLEASSSISRGSAFGRRSRGAGTASPCRRPGSCRPPGATNRADRPPGPRTLRIAASRSSSSANACCWTRSTNASRSRVSRAPRTPPIRSAPRGGVSAGLRRRATATSAPSNPRSRARAQNGVALAGSTERYKARRTGGTARSAIGRAACGC